MILSTKGQLAYDAISEMIFSHQWRSGERYSVLEISEKLQMSRSPVSQAVKLLASQGFITLQTKRGFSVRSYSSREILDMLEVKAALDGLAGFQAAGRIDSSHLDALNACLQKYGKALREKDNSMAKSSDYSLHRSIAEIGGNDYLTQEIDMLWRHGDMYLDTYFGESSGFGEARYEEHAEIVKAIISGDSTLARELCEMHGMKFYEAVKARFETSVDTKITNLDAAKNALTKGYCG